MENVKNHSNSAVLSIETNNEAKKTSQVNTETKLNNSLIVREGNFIYFGSYPQSKKEKNVIVYDDGSGSDGNKYCRISHYCYKYEPIKWEILYENESEILLISEKILDYKWAYKKDQMIHAIEEFSSQAFSDEEKVYCIPDEKYNDSGKEILVSLMTPTRLRERLSFKQRFKKSTDYAIIQGGSKGSWMLDEFSTENQDTNEYYKYTGYFATIVNSLGLIQKVQTRKEATSDYSRRFGKTSKFNDIYGLVPILKLNKKV